MNAREWFGLKSGASVAEVKAHWQQQALKYHPDHGGDVKEFMSWKDRYKSALKEANAPKKCPACNNTKKIRKSRGFYSTNITCPYCK